MPIQDNGCHLELTDRTHKCPQEAVSSLPQRKTTLSTNSAPKSHMKTTFPLHPSSPSRRDPQPKKTTPSHSEVLSYNLGLSLAAGRSIPRTRVRAFTADPVGGRRLKKEEKEVRESSKNDEIT